MGTFLLIGSGGFLGAIIRYLLSNYVQNGVKSTEFPLGTLIVNLVGCLIFGALGQLSETRDIFTPETSSLIFIGFLGAFTTFSTFGSDSFNLIKNGQNLFFYLNIGGSVILGLLSVWAGRNIAAYFLR
ncbi:MAG: fluoride efflux transporter CrcB [Anaerolineae bacterium]|jgi:fluoride exporter|nr:fluoride efflux transporter CrcB [Anaerolineae bacterium]MBT7075232.1 fluoride efflux transporter CrcB [Anaerolineae bacterium]MBT7781845.1 fluoride efflux transporter CrcB [Anaerolineae bacterium]